MPIKVTSTQIRPNTDVEWYTPDKLGSEMAKHSLGYDNILLEAPTVEISQDGLVYTKTFLFPDGWDLESRNNGDYVDAMRTYMEVNNIEAEFEIKQI